MRHQLTHKESRLYRFHQQCITANAKNGDHASKTVPAILYTVLRRRQFRAHWIRDMIICSGLPLLQWAYERSFPLYAYWIHPIVSYSRRGVNYLWSSPSLFMDFIDWLMRVTPSPRPAHWNEALTAYDNPEQGMRLMAREKKDGFLLLLDCGERSRLTTPLSNWTRLHYSFVCVHPFGCVQ